MADVVRELLFTEAAVQKLGRRVISRREARQLVHNLYVLSKNPKRNREIKVSLRVRRLMIGTTNGGRALTLVVQRTPEPTDWLIITGWDSANHERRMLERWR
jgi:hypothetical protein